MITHKLHPVYDRISITIFTPKMYQSFDLQSQKLKSNFEKKIKFNRSTIICIHACRFVFTFLIIGEFEGVYTWQDIPLREKSTWEETR